MFGQIIAPDKDMGIIKLARSPLPVSDAAQEVEDEAERKALQGGSEKKRAKKEHAHDDKIFTKPCRSTKAVDPEFPVCPDQNELRAEDMSVHQAKITRWKRDTQF